mgnify:CR=1 FL=1
MSFFDMRSAAQCSHTRYKYILVLLAHHSGMLTYLIRLQYKLFLIRQLSRRTHEKKNLAILKETSDNEGQDRWLRLKEIQFE